MTTGQGQGFTVPGPTSGLDLVGPIDSMDPTSALELVNMISRGNGSEVRAGYSAYADTGNVSEVGTLVPLPLGSGTTKLLGCATGKIYDVLNGSVSDITGSSVPSSGRWNATTFGYRAYLCNGVDPVQVYDGSSVADSTFTGVTLSNLVNVSTYKERVYFVEKGTLKIWYGNSQALGAGALNSADLKFAFSLGGYLLFAGSWTDKYGVSTSDLFFACSSEGEIIFFQGSSPADVSTPWGSVARFVVGRPRGYRSFLRVNSDIWIVTDQGIVPVSQLFSTDLESILEQGVGRRINPLISQWSAVSGVSHLWHGVHWSQGREVLISIPTSGAGNILAVYAQDSQSWTTYQLHNSDDALALATAGGSLFYGSGSGKVYLGETGLNDAGEAISFSGRLPFSFYGQRGTYKTFTDVRPLMRTKRGVQMSLGIDTNFQRTPNLDTIATVPGIYTPWGSAWGSPWSEGISYVYDRYSLRGQGHCGALRFRGTVKDAPLQLFGFEIRFLAGGQV